LYENGAFTYGALLASSRVLYAIGIAKPELGCFRRKNARREK